MSHQIRSRVARLLSTLMTLALLGACADGPNVETETFKTPEGLAVVQTVKMVATVQAINGRTRELTLKPRRGELIKLTADKAVANFNQIQIGDEVHAEVVEEFAITLVPGGVPDSAAAADSVALAPLGAKPGIVTVNTRALTATVVAIDAHDHTVSLEFLDGTVRDLQVSKNRDLSNVMLGDSVRAQITEAIAISVVKPVKK